MDSSLSGTISWLFLKIDLGPVPSVLALWRSGTVRLTAGGEGELRWRRASGVAQPCDSYSLEQLRSGCPSNCKTPALDNEIECPSSEEGSLGMCRAGGLHRCRRPEHKESCSRSPSLGAAIEWGSRPTAWNRLKLIPAIRIRDVVIDYHAMRHH